MNADEIVKMLRTMATYDCGYEEESDAAMAAIDLIESLQAQLSASQRREKAAVGLINEIRSDATGDWSFIMFKIDNWRCQQKAEKGEQK